MRRLSCLLVLVGLAAGARAGDPPSGPQVGDKLPDFKAKAFSGPDAGKEFKLHDRTKGGPTLLVFVHRLTRPGFKLLRAVDDAAIKEEKLLTLYVWLSEDVEKTEEFFKRAQASLNLQAPLTVCLDGKDGPPAYGLNDQVAVTVLIAKDHQVVSNFAQVDPNETDAPKVIRAIGKVLGK